jgi:hypothetical protein
MEKKHGALEAKYSRLKEALEEKKTAEKATNDIKDEKKAMELERHSWKKKAVELEGDLAKAKSSVEDGKGALALYFDNGFERARAQVLHFNPDANVSELDPFKILVDGKLVDEEWCCCVFFAFVFCN